MNNNQINFIGWLPFVASAFGVCIASIARFWGIFGAKLFWTACYAFMIPTVRKSQ